MICNAVFGMGNNTRMRDSLTAIGGGSSMVGLIFLLAGNHSSHLWMPIVGKILIGVGAVLLAFRAWRQWKS